MERELVHPMSNLIASAQIRGGDMIRVAFDEAEGRLDFVREAEMLPLYEMSKLADTSGDAAMAGAVAAPDTDNSLAANARIARRG
jgi:hypothetical protein